MKDRKSVTTLFMSIMILLFIGVIIITSFLPSVFYWIKISGARCDFDWIGHLVNGTLEGMTGEHWLVCTLTTKRLQNHLIPNSLFWRKPIAVRENSVCLCYRSKNAWFFGTFE